MASYKLKRTLFFYKRSLTRRFIEKNIYLYIFFLCGILLIIYSKSQINNGWESSICQNIGSGFITSATVIFFYDTVRIKTENYEKTYKRGMYLLDLIDKIISLLTIFLVISGYLKKDREIMIEEILDMPNIEKILQEIKTSKFFKTIHGLQNYRYLIKKGYENHIAVEWFPPYTDRFAIIQDGKTFEEMMRIYIDEISILANEIFLYHGNQISTEALAMILQIKSFKSFSQKSNWDELLEQFPQFIYSISWISRYYEYSCVNGKAGVDKEILTHIVPRIHFVCKYQLVLDSEVEKS